MKFYNRYYKSNFHELISHYPRYYRDVFEMVEILKAQGRVMDALEDSVEQTFLDHFVLTASLPAIKTWEGFLGITYQEQLTLEQRRSVVVARLCSMGHIGEQEIRAMIGQYTPNHVDVDFLRGTISILIEGAVFDEENLLKTLLKRIPAHLALDMSVHIRKQYRQTVPFQQVAADAPWIAGEPPMPGGVSKMDCRFRQGGTSTSETDSGTPQVRETARGRSMASGGLFCRTHIQSKRID